MESSVRVHGYSGRVEESKLLSRGHFCMLQGEHDRNYQRLKNQSSENNDWYAFYEANMHPIFKGRGTNPKKRRQLCILQGAQPCYCKVSRNHKSEKDGSSAFRDDKEREVTSDPN